MVFLVKKIFILYLKLFLIGLSPLHGDLTTSDFACLVVKSSDVKERVVDLSKSKKLPLEIQKKLHLSVKDRREVGGESFLADGSWYLVFLDGQKTVHRVLWVPAMTKPTALCKEVKFTQKKKLILGGRVQAKGRWIQLEGMREVVRWMLDSK